MSFQGQKNIYVCKRCHGHIVTVDKDKGTSLFMISCKATPHCKGMMRSSMYRVYDQTIKASHEWYTPDSAELATLSPPVREHVETFGLILREIKE